MENGVLVAAHKVSGYVGITRLAVGTAEEEKEGKELNCVHTGHKFSFSKGADAQLSQQSSGGGGLEWGGHSAALGLPNIPFRRAFPGISKERSTLLGTLK